MLGTMVYLVRKPRVSMAFEEGPRVAEIGPGGEPIFPVGLPHCRRDGLVYPSGTQRCERCHDELVGHLPDVLARAVGADRHVHELWSRPEGRAARRRGAHDDRAEARRRGRGVG